MGIYRTFEEFTKNQPGIAVKNITLQIPENPGKISEGFATDKIAVTDQSGKTIKLDDKSWGFNTGDRIFVSHGKKWLQLVVNQYFCYFEIPLETNILKTASTSPTDPGDGALLQEIRKIFMLTSAGIFESLTKDMVARVISDDKTLFSKFRDDEYAAMRLVRYLKDYYKKNQAEE
jgi:hypothetical protein